ncbi:hypothetical protein GCM10027299_21290 [Larkinella ripae]
MRILAPGNPEPERQVTCHKCGCVFAYVNKDLDLPEMGGAWVSCPKCGQGCPASYWYRK